MFCKLTRRGVLLWTRETKNLYVNKCILELRVWLRRIGSTGGSQQLASLDVTSYPS